jgi:hypothetical protein
MVHELLHSLFHQCPRIIAAALEQRLQPIFDDLLLATVPDRHTLKERQSQRNERIRTLWSPADNHKNWAHELAIDVMSLMLAGPAYAYWFLHRTATLDIHPHELVQSHPPFAVRARGLLIAAMEAPFRVEAELAARLQLWDESAGVKSNEFLSAARPDIVETIVGGAINLVKALRLPPYSQDRWEHCADFNRAATPDATATDLVSSACHAARHLEPAEYHAWTDRTTGQWLPGD